MHLSDRFFKGRKLETLVENQTSYSLNNAAMHVFETHQQAEQVILQFNQPVLASMLRGKKIMHLKNKAPFDFVPGESLVLPPQEIMCIDFPEAEMQNPTRCLAMAINEDKIQKTLMIMNENLPKSEFNEWGNIGYNFHFTNDYSVHQIIQRLLFLFTEDHPSKDFFVDNMLQELIIRILQTNNKALYLANEKNGGTSERITFVVEYMLFNIDQKITIELLSEKACMSESNFYKVFKNEMGQSPMNFLNEERLKLAKKLLKDPNRKVKDVYLNCGFESRSYFNRLFKRHTGFTPGEYQKK